MAEQTLPAVAKSVYTDCKKCGAERYHVVLAHTSDTAAKVECEICHSKKTYKLPKEKKVKKAKMVIPGQKPKVAAPRGAVARAAAHEQEYQNLLSGSGEVAPYSMKNKFSSNQKIQHPKFGVGIVKTALLDKVEVIFSDEIRNLVHNRG